MPIQKNSIVTVDLGFPNSNTFIIDTVEEETVLVSHPLASGLLMRVSKDGVDTKSPNIKDSIERGIDYANSNKDLLDYNTASDLEALGIVFTFKRKLTPSLKQMLANICGNIASVKFEDDIKRASKFILQNKSMLDEFNTMWFNNFKPLLLGQQQITSKKQRVAIFNIAGYALAEMENPTANRRK